MSLLFSNPDQHYRLRQILRNFVRHQTEIELRTDFKMVKGSRCTMATWFLRKIYCKSQNPPSSTFPAIENVPKTKLLQQRPNLFPTNHIGEYRDYALKIHANNNTSKVRKERFCCSFVGNSARNNSFRSSDVFRRKYERNKSFPGVFSAQCCLSMKTPTHSALTEAMRSMGPMRCLFFGLSFDEIVSQRSLTES